MIYSSFVRLLCRICTIFTSIRIRKDALSFYDETIHSWKAEAGEFEALVGNAADNICSKVKFTLR